MKKALCLVLVLGIISIPVMANTVKGSLSFSLDTKEIEKSLILVQPVFDPAIVQRKVKTYKEKTSTGVVIGIGMVFLGAFIAGYLISKAGGVEKKVISVN